MSRHAAPRWGVIVASVVVLFAIAATAGWLYWSRPLAPRLDPEMASPTATQPSPRPSTPSPTTVQQKPCLGHKPFVPTKLEVLQLGIDMPIATLPLREDGTYPVPLYDDPRFDPKWSAVRWSQNVLACAKSGVVRLVVHTYSVGGAAGNVLGHKAQPGDVIRVASGKHEACYGVRNVRTWDLDEVPYDTLTSPTGPAGLVIAFCWDKPSQWGQWLQRRYVIAEPQTCG